jgi:hypothetical protein
VEGRRTRQVAFEVGSIVTVLIALGRAAGVVVGAVRSLAGRQQFAVVRFGAVEAITLLEPLVLSVTAIVLLVGRPAASSVSAGEAIAALAGALTAVLGLGLILWTLLLLEEPVRRARNSCWSAAHHPRCLPPAAPPGLPWGAADLERPEPVLPELRRRSHHGALRDSRVPALHPLGGEDDA